MHVHVMVKYSTNTAEWCLSSLSGSQNKTGLVTVNVTLFDRSCRCIDPQQSDFVCCFNQPNLKNKNVFSEFYVSDSLFTDW